MTVKGEGPAEEWQEIDRWGGGVGWMAYPDEEMQRASHALAVDETSGDRPPGDVWVLDPVDTPGVDDLLAEFGDLAGVAVLLDRHKRDAAKIATRHDVPVWLPEWMGGVAEDLDARIQRFGDHLPGTDFRVVPVVDNRFWQEAALYDGETLFVPEAVGTAEYFRSGGRPLGVHPMLRLLPPRDQLGKFAPVRILVGHGEGVHESAATALTEALAGARRTAPRVYAKALAGFLRG